MGSVMSVPMAVTFHGMAQNEWIEAEVRARADKLEKYCGDIKAHVENALDWEPSVDASDVGVSVEDGVVTLRGNVRAYAEKGAAERVALRVYGVKGVADDLNVRLLVGYERSDTDIAQAAVAALKWNTLVPADRVTGAVSNGWLTLRGTLE